MTQHERPHFDERGSCDCTCDECNLWVEVPGQLASDEDRCICAACTGCGLMHAGVNP